MKCPRCESNILEITETVIRRKTIEAPEGMSIETMKESELQSDTISIKCTMCGYTDYGQHADVTFECEWFPSDHTLMYFDGKVSQEEFMEVVHREAIVHPAIDDALNDEWRPTLKELWQMRVTDITIKANHSPDIVVPSLLLHISPTDVQKLTAVIDEDTFVEAANEFLEESERR